jgi:hypothetical protein
MPSFALRNISFESRWHGASAILPTLELAWRFLSSKEFRDLGFAIPAPGPFFASLTAAAVYFFFVRVCVDHG